MEDGIEQSMSMLIQEAEQKKQTVQKPLSQAAFQQVHPVGLSLPTDRNASSYPLKDTIPPRDTTPLTNTNSGS